MQNDNNAKIKKEKVLIDDGEDYTVASYTPGKMFKNVFDIVEAFVYAVIAVLFIFTFFVRLTIVNGPSMENTLKQGQYLAVANVFFTYEPKNGDIVVIHGDFENYLEGTHNNKYDVVGDYSRPIVKRVIATGGQTIKIDFKTSEVFVDGKLLKEDYTKDDIMFTFRDYRSFLRQLKTDDDGNYVLDKNGEIICEICYDPLNYVLEAKVPKNHVFVMGDNRNDSMDSRHRDIGFVPEEFIVGKAIFRLAPFTIF